MNSARFCSVALYCLILCFFQQFQKSNSVPDDTCLHPFNSSDCHGAPTPVFAYYKPGSRCEVEIWRGCPTFNIFENEYVCSHYCIGRLLFDDAEGKKPSSVDGTKTTNPIASRVTFDEENSTGSTDPDGKDAEYCFHHMNDSHCSDDMMRKMYSFNRIYCVCEPVQWRGCPAMNIFEKLQDCQDLCKVHNCLMDGYKTNIKLTLSDKEVKDIDAILDVVSSEPLMLEHVKEITTTEIITLNTKTSAGKVKMAGKVTIKLSTKAVPSKETEAVKTTVETKQEQTDAQTTEKVVDTTELSTISPVLPHEVEVDY